MSLRVRPKLSEVLLFKEGWRGVDVLTPHPPWAFMCYNILKIFKIDKGRRMDILSLA